MNTMTENQLIARIETLEWCLDTTIGDRTELYRELDEAVFELNSRLQKAA